MFEMQIKIDNEWVSVKRSGTLIPYRYKTYDDAWRNLSMCYPDLTYDRVRVLEVDHAE